MDAATLTKIRGGMSGLAPPQPRQKVGNRECAYSFDSPYAEGGLFVNLKTFAGCGRDFVKKDAAAHKLFYTRTTGGPKFLKRTSR